MLAALRDAYQTTHLVYHHNKNQHHAAKWWKWLAMLKRTVLRVMDRLVILADDQYDDSDSDSDDSNDSDGSEEWKHDEALVRLAAYLRRRVVPRAYLYDAMLCRCPGLSFLFLFFIFLFLQAWLG